MRLDALLSFLAVEPPGGQQPPDVGGVAQLNFSEVPSAMPAESQNEFSTVFTYLTHRINGLEIVQSAPQFRCVARTVAVHDPAIEFG